MLFYTKLCCQVSKAEAENLHSIQKTLWRTDMQKCEYKFYFPEINSLPWTLWGKLCLLEKENPNCLEKNYRNLCCLTHVFQSVAAVLSWSFYLMLYVVAE